MATSLLLREHSQADLNLKALVWPRGPVKQMTVLLFSYSVGPLWGYLLSRSVSLSALLEEIWQLFKYFQECEIISYFISMQPTKDTVRKEIMSSVFIACCLIPIPSPQVTKMLLCPEQWIGTSCPYFIQQDSIYMHMCIQIHLFMLSCLLVLYFLLLLGCVLYFFTSFGLCMTQVSSFYCPGLLCRTPTI